MPSLRRTLSSPSVRASPYPSTLSIAANHARGQGGHPRRSSGAETSGRRVLADIDWWRVCDGQREGEADQESGDRDQDQDQAQEADAPASQLASPTSESGAELPVSPLTWSFDFESLFGEANASTQTMQHEEPVAALPVFPQTPPRRHGGRESSDSSVDSTPDGPETRIEGLRRGLADLDLEEDGVPSTLPRFPSRHANGRPAFLSLRAHSFDVSTLSRDTDGRFSDVLSPGLLL